MLLTAAIAALIDDATRAKKRRGEDFHRHGTSTSTFAAIARQETSRSNPP
jgi:hypothetical protein